MTRLRLHPTLPAKDYLRLPRMASLLLSDITKRFRSNRFGHDVVAVADINLEIVDGEFVTLVGPSGCGKSTLLNIIAGLETPSTGQIRIDGKLVNDLPPRKRDVAMVFQDYALYPHMDVFANIAFPLRCRKQSPSEIRTKVFTTAEKIGISDLLTRKPRELSGGQRQRVALARALVRHPKIFLFDEPLSNLDPALRVELRHEIKQLHRQLRTTFIYVTHDQTEAMTLSDRVIVLDHGHIQQISHPRDVYDKPANLFVAAFFGWPKINLIEAEKLDWTVPLPGSRSREELVVGFRPEATTATMGETPKQMTGETLVGQVEFIEPTGVDDWITLRVQDVAVRGRATSRGNIAAGDHAWVQTDFERLLWFDRETGKRIAN